MDELFTKFYSVHINEIHAFLDSDSDVLYITGYSGSGKSSVLKNAINSYGEDILKFHHLCFKGTVTDDFLLSFYDTFRNYAIREKISLKKNPEEGFMDKVSFYFKNLEKKAVVIIDNFEAIANEEEITDFLIHIAGFNNVKVIVISKNPTCSLVENPTISLEKIYFEKINLFEFQEVLSDYFKEEDPALIEELYEATDGYELYLKMVTTYLESTFTPLKSLMEEYREKEISFGDFMINKQISLIPNNYYSLLENLSCIYHNVPVDFIEAYSLGDIKQFSYLISKFAVSEFFGTYYIKSYLRKRFQENISLQSKVEIFNKLISIYENELEKSPKDRILRLSRESIRKQIVFLKESAPKVQKINSTPTFNYVAQAIVNNPNWFVTEANKPMRGMNNLRRKKEQRKERIQNFEPKEILKNSLFEEIISNAENLIQEYKFKEAEDKLIEAKPLAKTFLEKINVYSKLANCATKLNDNNLALSNLRELCEICLTEGDSDSWAKYRIEIGKIYKKLYAFSRAKTCFEEIIKKEEYISKRTIATSRLSLGDIYELENNFEQALDEYKIAHDLIIENESEYDPILPEISYKTASLYDENGYYDEALIEYQKAIEYSNNSNNEFYLLKAYTNLGVILADMGEYEEAESYLTEELEISNKTDNYIDTYYIARNIAEIYKTLDPEKVYDYLNLALEYARLSENSFEIAISLIELGDYYYDLKQNEQALICYFQAKTTLGTSASKENMEKVTTRINDMKIKLGDYVFYGMKELYDPE